MKKFLVSLYFLAFTGTLHSINQAGWERAVYRCRTEQDYFYSRAGRMGNEAQRKFRQEMPEEEKGDNRLWGCQYNFDPMPRRPVQESSRPRELSEAMRWVNVLLSSCKDGPTHLPCGCVEVDVSKKVPKHLERCCVKSAGERHRDYDLPCTEAERRYRGLSFLQHPDLSKFSIYLTYFRLLRMKRILVGCADHCCDLPVVEKVGLDTNQLEAKLFLDGLKEYREWTKAQASKCKECMARSMNR